ncbi:MAG: prephenate dehydrogenase/arogenate dehydrogenase family protein [Jatrophihabitans sp.]
MPHTPSDPRRDRQRQQSLVAPFVTTSLCLAPPGGAPSGTPDLRDPDTKPSRSVVDSRAGPNDRVRGVAATFRQIGVLGLGLIGGSLLRAVRATGRDCWGYDLDPATLIAAGEDGFEIAGSVAEAAADADLLVLAMPLTEVPQALAELSSAIGPRTVLTDVGTLKRPVAAAVESTLPGTRFVGGHPLAGTENSGWRAADAELFDGAPWSLTLTDDDAPHGVAHLDAWLGIADLVCELGAHPVPTTAAEQDDAVARVIGLPHVLAEVLALTGLSGGPLGLSLAAGSYTTGSRVARTRPELVATWCDGNVALTAALDEVISLLATTRDALAAGRSVLPLAREGHQARMNWESRSARPVVVPADRESLLEHGRAGGWITSVDLAGSVPAVHGMVPR